MGFQKNKNSVKKIRNIECREYEKRKTIFMHCIECKNRLGVFSDDESSRKVFVTVDYYSLNGHVRKKKKTFSTAPHV